MTTPFPPGPPESTAPMPHASGPVQEPKQPSRLRGRVIAGVVATVTFVAGIAIGAGGESQDEPEQPAAESSDTAAVEEQITTLQGEVDDLTTERDGLRASVTELESAVAAAEEAAAAAAAEEPAPAEEPAADEAPPAEGVYTAGQFSFADVQVYDDGLGDFALRTRITNTGDPVEGVLWKATLFLDGTVVATLDGNAQGFAAEATVTVEFYSLDSFGDYDTVEFQVDGQY